MRIIKIEEYAGVDIYLDTKEGYFLCNIEDTHKARLGGVATFRNDNYNALKESITNTINDNNSLETVWIISSNALTFKQVKVVGNDKGVEVYSDGTTSTSIMFKYGNWVVLRDANLTDKDRAKIEYLREEVKEAHTRVETVSLTYIDAKASLIDFVKSLAKKD